MASIGYGYGSEWHLLQYLGRRRAAFTRAVESVTGCRRLHWLDSKEYTDEDAHLRVRELKGLEFLPAEDATRREWEQLWPQTGNVHNWDAVGQSESSTGTIWVLVEAKAHIGEFQSRCTATSSDSRRRIRDVLDDARSRLRAQTDNDWLETHYQYCNRLALLEFIVGRGVDAHLLLVCFTGDRSDLGMRGRECPPNEEIWQRALKAQSAYVGLPKDSPLENRVHHLVLPAYRANIDERLLRPEYLRKATKPHPQRVEGSLT